MDLYIDYLEVGEYGEHFLDASAKLVGASPLVDVAGLRARVTEAVAKVDNELEKVGVKRSALRSGRQDTDTKTASVRKEIERFWNYIGSLDDDITIDLNAFFDGGKLGALAALKPGDVKSKADAVLRGFQAPKNASVPDRAKWEGKLQKARDALADALSDKGGAHAVAIQSTAGLAEAREQFLALYNGVAKRLIQGILIDLGRKDEYELFFKDLLVNEGGPTKKPAAAAPPGNDAAPAAGSSAPAP